MNHRFWLSGVGGVLTWGLVRFIAASILIHANEPTAMADVKGDSRPIHSPMIKSLSQLPISTVGDGQTRLTR
ncbi:hypothetical protein IRT45_32890 [Nocardia sp. BSTN01]|uniref:hypothetical protein n=1 Tax=Nocardia sp. BSTN01 TaxID=2783665 RepID=UPI00188FFF22|nr:hypothetical protein [Nocardia sp. BSTN01]MBF5001919.1 hypothetical protein [Nocardia sp. BSTN01]